MKLILAGLVSITLVLVANGCASKKPLRHQGWIGGEYLAADSRKWKSWNSQTLDAFPTDLESKQMAAIFVSNVFSNTPLAIADIRPGDLILSVGGHTVRDLAGFYGIINKSKPGSILPISVFRDGKTDERNITIGKETYKEWRNVSAGLVFYLKLDLIPNPDFSLIALGYSHEPKHPELRSPMNEFIRKVESEKKHKPAEEIPIEGEGWSFWLVVFGLSGHKDIFSQEIVNPGRD